MRPPRGLYCREAEWIIETYLAGWVSALYRRTSLDVDELPYLHRR